METSYLICKLEELERHSAAAGTTKLSILLIAALDKIEELVFENGELEEAIELSEECSDKYKESLMNIDNCIKGSKSPLARKIKDIINDADI